jgi:FkbM family methyltransferase
MTLAQILLHVRPVELAEFLKKALGIDYREVRVGELTLWADPASNFGNRVINDGNYEPEFTASLLRLLKPGACFVDLGANEGWFSLQASGAVGPGGMVYAIEPQRRLWPVIHQNFILNGRSNYRLIPYAVSQQEGFIDLILHPSLNTGSTTAVSDLRRAMFRRQKTGALPLEAIMRRFSIPKIDVLKIDIEGFELNALRSLGPRLSDGSVDSILIEFHPAQLKELGQSKEDVVRLLRESGYGCSGADDTVWTRVGAGN